MAKVEKTTPSNPGTLTKALCECLLAPETTTVHPDDTKEER